MSLIFLFLLLSSCSFSLLYAADDGAVLLKIKEELGNPDILSSWVEGFNFCNNSETSSNIYISCSDSGRLTGINFYYVIVHNVSFPQAICNLTELEYFSMELVFGMNGPLPYCINNLVNLRAFSLNRVGFHTPIPEFLNNKNLTVIDLHKSGAIAGPIPPYLSTSNLPNLEILDLSWNGLTGPIPWELAHNPPPYLYLNDNYMSGELPKCATWKNLRSISLSHNGFSGDPSSLFGKEKTVTYIDLSINSFEFNISNIEAPENLTYLNLEYNSFYGKVPKSFANKPGLSLNLRSNIPCPGKNEEPHPCVCWDTPESPCPVLPPSPAP